MSAVTDVIMALGGAGVGTGIFKAIEVWLTKSKSKSTQDKELRDELRDNAVALRAEIDALKAELRETEKVLDHWKEQYWKIFMDFRMFQIEIRAILMKNGIDPDDVLSPDSKPEMEA